MFSRPAFAVALVTSLMLSAVPFVAADHPQSAGGKTVRFDHHAGNEWWVEVKLHGADGASATSVEAMDTGGPWVALSKTSWGTWAKSFHIEPGHTVGFRAGWSDGTQIESCTFTHPAGTEQCGAPPPPSDFTATFTLVTGNEWWVQTQVTPSGGTLSKVDVRLNEGSWKPLQLQSWGVRMYAASYHMPEGTIVQFQATSATGATALSGCYRWIPPQGGGQTATEVECGSAPVPSAFSASFTGVKGNNWWVETKVFANRPLAGVDARVQGGEWRALTLRDWGAWAASFHVPDGAPVQLRARSTDGATAFVPNGWTWTAATEYPARSSTFDARFENVKGNTDWVQVNVYSPSNWGHIGVSARVEDGPWQALARQDWGDWAASMHVENGSFVQFRAEAPAGGPTIVSDRYVWPSGMPVTPWPREGSFVRYTFRAGESSPGGDWYDVDQGELLFTYASGAWSLRCTGTNTVYREWEEPHYTNTTFDVTLAAAPPLGPTETAPNTNETIDWHFGCEPGEREVEVKGEGPAPTRLHDAQGNAMWLPAWEGGDLDWQEECGCQGNTAHWNTRYGLMYDWWFGGRASGQSGEMIATNAPIR